MSDQYQGQDKGKQNTVVTQVQRVREGFLEDEQKLAREKKKKKGGDIPGGGNSIYNEQFMLLSYY